MKKAVFLDRDGVLIEQVAYLSRPEQVALIPGAVEALELVHRHGDVAVVISNQSGVGRGYFTTADVDAVHDRIQQLLAERGERVDAFYYCPHAPGEACGCRKPSPEMILRAAERFGVDVGASLMLGDRMSDLECGVNAGCAASVLVLTGYGEEQSPKAREAGFAVARDMLAAVRDFYGEKEMASMPS